MYLYFDSCLVYCIIKVKVLVLLKETLIYLLPSLHFKLSLVDYITKWNQLTPMLGIGMVCVCVCVFDAFVHYRHYEDIKHLQDDFVKKKYHEWVCF